jgi:hypothetical protein
MTYPGFNPGAFWVSCQCYQLSQGGRQVRNATASKMTSHKFYRRPRTGAPRLVSYYFLNKKGFFWK